jgi:hypothetical protein
MNTASILLSTLFLFPVQQFSSQNSLIEQEKQELFTYRQLINNAWKPGEKLEYRVHYGIVNAGKIEMQIDDQKTEVQGRKAYHINANGRTSSGFDWMFKVRDNYQTYIDSQSIIPLKFTKTQLEGGYKDKDLAFFMHQQQKVVAHKGTAVIPENVQDIISAIYYARTIDVKNAYVGQVFPIQIYLDGEIFSLGIKYLGKEKIKTDLGTINALKIHPQVVSSRVFKDENALLLWVSDDENKVPLKVKADLLIGSLKVDITNYQHLKHELNRAK